MNAYLDSITVKEIEPRFGIYGVIISIIGLLVGIATMYFGLEDGYSIFSISQDYTNVGLVLRFFCGALGLVGLVLSTIALVKKEPTDVFLISTGLSITCLAIEFALVTIILSIVIYIVANYFLDF